MGDKPHLIVGDTYYTLAFEDETFTRPVVESFEYLGFDLSGACDDRGEPYFDFRFIGSDDQAVLTTSQTQDILDINGLIQALQDFRDRGHA
jgi:hypothetical protein